MGRECIFYFYKLKNGKLVPEPAATVNWGRGPEKINYLFICGRCEATNIFSNVVSGKESPHSYFGNDKLKPEEKYSAYLLLNHPELDGFEVHKEKDDPDYECYGDWFEKYFYFGLEEFRNLFDFEKAQKEHDDWLNRLKENIKDYQKDIESLRKHQEKAKTKVAFDCFEEKIQDIKENINDTKNSIEDIEEDDYGYNHYMYIKEDLQTVEKIIKDDPEIIVAAYVSE